MEQGIILLCIPWIVEELSSGAATLDIPGLKAKTAAAVTAAIPSKWVDTQLITVANQVIDALSKISQDQPDLTTMLKALAAKNPGAAAVALKSMIVPYLPAALASLL
jgi:hypothetical protein